MELSSRTPRIALSIIAVAAAVGVPLAIFHRGGDYKVVAAPAVVKGPAAQTESQPQQQARQRQPQAFPGNGDDLTLFVSVAETETSQLHDGFTLSQWMNLHGKNEGWTRTPEKQLEPTDWPRKECLSFVKTETLPSGARLGRALFFYPPRAPSPAIFPTGSRQELINGCVLAMIRLEAAVPTLDLGHAFDRAVRARFNGLYGESVGTKDVPFWGPAFRYEDATRWIPGAEIVSGYDAQGQFMPDEDPLVSAPFVFVRARLPLVQELSDAAKPYRALSLKARQFSRAVAAAGLDRALSQRMENLYHVDTRLAERLQAEAKEICKPGCKREAMPKPTGTDWKDPLVPLLQDWFNALRGAAAGDRAGGLLAADSLLIAFGSIGSVGNFGTSQSSTAEQSRLRSQLQALGATFEPDYADGTYYYSGSWLNEAKDLDPDSEGGKLALVTWMSTAGSCMQAGPAGLEIFRNVISKGEGLLTKRIDAPTKAQVHFMVGDAYSDIVAIARGESGGNGEYDPSKYEAEAESDRAKALAHYRAGLAIDNTSPAAKDAWSQAWHLSAGLLPRERYVCFGD